MKGKSFFLTAFAIGVIFTISLFSSPQQSKYRVMIDQGKEYYKEGNFEEAIKALQDVIKYSVDLTEVWDAQVYLGYVYFSIQEEANMQTQLEAAIQIKPNFTLNKEEFAPAYISKFEDIRKGFIGIGFFETIPSKTLIYLDDEKIGLTPLKIELLAKTYMLRFVKLGYEPFEEEIEIVQQQILNRKIDLNERKNWKTLVKASSVMIVLGLIISNI